jgi:hypothetical protein
MSENPAKVASNKCWVSYTKAKLLMGHERRRIQFDKVIKAEGRMRSNCSVALRVCLAASVPLSLSSAELPSRTTLPPIEPLVDSINSVSLLDAKLPKIDTLPPKSASCRAAEVSANPNTAVAGPLIWKRLRILCPSLVPTAVC